jgi:citrate lyase subunit beta/citryl-CoA lyase
MRSLLYVPADRPDTAVDADGVLLDLKPGGDPEAVRDMIERNGPQGTLWVRVKPGEEGFLQARAVVCQALAGVCVSRAASATELAALGSVLAEAEEANRMAVGTVAVLPVLETAAAVLGAADIARAPRVRQLMLDEAALRVQLGLESTEDERELLWVRSMVVLASAAADIRRPIGAVGDTDFRRSSLELKRLGFHGRACLSPEQVTVANEVFTNSDLGAVG